MSKIKFPFPDHADDSDRRLRERQFSISDPETIDGLKLDRPSSMEGAFIEYRYDLTPRPSDPPRPRVECCLCGYPNHHRGYVVKFQVGLRRLIGKDCAARHLGADWHEIERRFKDERMRKKFLLRCDEANILFPDLIEELSAVAAGHSVRAPLETKRTLEKVCPDLLSAMLQDPRGRLFVKERRRNRKAEADRAANFEKKFQKDLRRDFSMREIEGMSAAELNRRANDFLRTNPQFENKPIFGIVQREVHTVEAAALIGRPAVRPALLEDIDLLRVFWHQTRAISPQTSTQAIRKILRGAEKAAKDAAERLQRLNSLSAFFSHENVVGMVRWANEARAGGAPFDAVPDPIHEGCSFISCASGTVRAPEDLAAVDLTGLDLFIEAVSRTEERAT
ncbi:MAG: hypothetical protein RLW87_20595 [Alphaproteobacteria bacterium]